MCGGYIVSLCKGKHNSYFPRLSVTIEVRNALSSRLLISLSFFIFTDVLNFRIREESGTIMDGKGQMLVNLSLKFKGKDSIDLDTLMASIC